MFFHEKTCRQGLDHFPQRIAVGVHVGIVDRVELHSHWVLDLIEKTTSDPAPIGPYRIPCRKEGLRLLVHVHDLPPLLEPGGISAPKV